MFTTNLFDAAGAALLIKDPSAKIAEVTRLAETFDELVIDAGAAQPVTGTPIPGRPELPQLVAPRNLVQRGLGTPAGRAALVHAVAHIEFNAINLALDAIYRFRDLPVAYYADWISVASDEARHFGLLQARLLDLGVAYGDLPAHNGLWEAACATADSCLRRMALVPRVLEARGLDVTPGMIERLQRAGDERTVAILETILEEEVGHVAIGTRWFRHCCGIAGVEPDQTFLALVEAHALPTVRPPFNEQARFRAGFGIAEQAAIAALAGSNRQFGV